MIIDPVRIYQVKGEVCQLTAAPFNTIAIANNTTLITAVSGKRIRVMGLLAQSTGAAISDFVLKSASGGTAIMQPIAAPIETLPPFLLPITDSGYTETNTGEGLFIDVATTTLNITIFHIIYTP